MIKGPGARESGMLERMKILIVDDDPDMRAMIKAYLVNAGYAVFEAESGSAGLKKAGEITPNLILLDINMPGMDGLEVCRKLRGDPKNVFAIIMLTADETSEVAGLESGADDYIMKPFKKAALLARVRRSLESAGQRQDAIVDSLTGVFNRRGMGNFLAQEEERALRYNRPLAAIMVDIDHFKQVNDLHGHDVGDRVLIELARILRQTCRKSDLLARWGGEEFAVLLPETNAENAIVFAEKARVKIAAHHFQGVERLTASFGVAEHRKAAAADMMKRADLALYRAKQEGRNRVVADQANLGLGRIVNLLVVDDDQAIRDLIRVKMTARGYHVHSADGAAAAFCILQEHEVDLILIDQDMPGRDGLATFMAVREAWPRIPAIMVTAHGSKQLIKSFLLAGGRDFIEKPIVDFDSFDFRVKRVIREVARELEAEEKLREARVREEAQKAQSVFLASMSHELRTPLNSIQGMAYLLEKSGLGEEQLGHVRGISRAVTSLLALITNILDFSAVKVGEFTLERMAFQPAELLGKVAAKFTEKCRAKGLELVIRLAPEVPESLVGAPRSLEQVLTLLIDNGIKFTSKGGVTVTVSRVAVEAQRIMLAFAVRDSGIGMSSAEREQLFTPFSQLDGSISRSYGGIGLGLTLGRKIVGLMNGEITAASEPGQGSTFTFTAQFEVGDAEVVGEELVIIVPEAEGQSDSSAGEAEVVDLAVLIPLFRELAELLDANDTRAGRVLGVLLGYRYPSGLDKEVRRLGRAVAAYDFEAAAMVLADIAARGDFSLAAGE